MSDEQLTPEQKVRLAEAEAATATANAEAEKARQSAAERETETRNLRMNDTLNKVIGASAIKSHHTPAELLKVLSKEDGVTIAPDATGENLVVTVDGKESTFDKVLEKYAVEHPTEFDRRTLRYLLGDETDVKPKGKAEMTKEEKLAFLDKHGAIAYEKLGLYHVTTLDADKLTASDWSHMTYAQKAKVISESPDGELVVSRILKRTTEKK